MAAATYRVAAGALFSPSDLKADADTLQGQIEALDAMIEGNESLDPNFVNQWVAFDGQWAAFYYQDFGGAVQNFLTALNDGNRDQLISYENQFQQLYGSSGLTLDNVVQPPTSSPSGLPSVSDVELILGLVLAIIVVGAVLR